MLKVKYNKLLIFFLVLAFRADKLNLSLMLFLSILQALQPAISALLLKNIIDSAANTLINNQVNVFEQSFVVFSVLQVLTLLVGSIASSLYIGLNEKYSQNLRNYVEYSIINKSLKIDIEIFNTSMIYDKMQLSFDEGSTRPIQVVNDCVSMLQATITLLSISIIAIGFNPMVAFLAILSAVPQSFGLHINNTLYFQFYYKNLSVLRVKAYMIGLFSQINFITEAHFYKSGVHLVNEWQKIVNIYGKDYFNLINRRVRIILKYFVASNILLALCYYSVYLTVKGSMQSIGGLSVILGLILQIQSSSFSAIRSVSTIFNHLTYLEAYQEFITSEEKDLVLIEEFISIRLEKVFYRYFGNQHDTLHDVNLELCRGDVAYIGGKNGAGKSTLSRLITGLYKNYSGKIYVNDRLMENRSFKGPCSIVLQDFVQYGIKLKDSVIFDGSQITTLQYKEIISFYHELPEKEDTILNPAFDKGVQLSGGQWQRLAIARALVNDSSLIIFDEPTASLDLIGRNQLLKIIKEICENKIIIIISHDERIKEFCNKIIEVNEMEDEYYETDSATHS